MRLFRLVPALLLLTLPSAAVDPWPQWRGPRRDAHVLGFQPPAAWPSRLTALWSATVGEGYSSPVATEKLICTHGRQSDAEVVSCYDRESGKLVWSDRYNSAFQKSSYALRMAPGPYSTPLISGSALYTLGANAVLTAYDLPTGKIRWRRQPKQTPTTGGLFTGTAMSPLLDESRLIVFWGDDRGGEFLALDPNTGVTLWTNSDDHPVYASPAVATFGGVRQYVTLAERNVLGVDARSGKTLWRIPYKDEWNENIITPIVDGDALILSGVRKPTTAWRMTNNEPVELWSNKDVSFYMSTPILEEGRLYGFNAKQKGQLVVLDVKTGARLKATEGRWADNAHLIMTPKNLIAMTSGGALVVLTRDLKEAARYETSNAPVWSHPVLDRDRVFVRDLNTLRAFAVR